MNADFTIRPYHAGDEEEIVQLLELVFDGWPRIDRDSTSLEHWRWKYLDNPLRMSSIVVGESGGRIIGCDHYGYRSVKLREKTFIFAQGMDSAVHPEFRRMGVYTKLGDKKNEFRDALKVDLNYWISGNPVIIRIGLKKGRKYFPHAIRNLVRIKDINQQLRMMPVDRPWLAKMGFHTLRFVNSVMKTWWRPHRSENLKITRVNSFDDRIDEFWRRVSKDYAFIGERDKVYLNWRYCDPRAGKFTVNQVEEDGEILGYDVLAINNYRGDYPIGFVVDFLCLRERPDVAEAMVADAIEFFDEAMVNIVNFLVVKGHPYESIFKRHGFLDSRVKFYLFYNTVNLADEMSKLENDAADDVLFSWGDNDSLPVNPPKYDV